MRQLRIIPLAPAPSVIGGGSDGDKQAVASLFIFSFCGAHAFQANPSFDHQNVRRLAVGFCQKRLSFEPPRQRGSERDGRKDKPPGQGGPPYRATLKKPSKHLQSTLLQCRFGGFLSEWIKYRDRLIGRSA